MSSWNRRILLNVDCYNVVLNVVDNLKVEKIDELDGVKKENWKKDIFFSHLTASPAAATSAPAETVCSKEERDMMKMLKIGYQW